MLRDGQFLPEGKRLDIGAHWVPSFRRDDITSEEFATQSMLLGDRPRLRLRFRPGVGFWLAAFLVGFHLFKAASA